MKVKDVIKRLQEFDPEAEFWVATDLPYYEDLEIERDSFDSTTFEDGSKEVDLHIPTDEDDSWMDEDWDWWLILNKRIKKKVTKKLYDSLSKDGAYYFFSTYDYNFRVILKRALNKKCYQSKKGKLISGLDTRNNAQRVRGIKTSDVRQDMIDYMLSNMRQGYNYEGV